jgi:UDP-galactopyranose mutase
LDQALTARPRIGYSGVIDERMDLALLAEIAWRRPDWQFVMMGPVVKIPESSLPQRRNIHYLGLKTYQELPNYLAGWDAAIMPFALNAATRFISPTKTPEYLAAGKPVVSTPIRDVVEPYGRLGLVRIAGDAQAFISALEAALSGNSSAENAARDSFLATMSWDKTWDRMLTLMNQVAPGQHSRTGQAAQVEASEMG